MRAAFSLLALVIVAAIVLGLARRQLPAAPPRLGSAAASAPGVGGLPAPQAVGQEVQRSLDEAARRSADAASAAAN